MKFELRPMRLKRGFTRGQLSDRSGVPQTTISGIENDGKTPSAITAQKLADALQVDVKDLIVEEVKS